MSVLLLVFAAAGAARSAAAEETASSSIPSREAPSGVSAEPARADGSPRLKLVWIDVLGSAPFAAAGATGEASAILAGAGVATSWLIGDSDTVTMENELKVVLMAGAASGARLPERVMGGTRSGQQSRTTWIYLSNVLWALGLEGRAVPDLTRVEQDEVTRALGRVVAHEIVHAVAPHLPHSSRGLMASKMGRNVLLAAHVALQPIEQSAFRLGALAFAPTDPENAPITLATAKR